MIMVPKKKLKEGQKMFKIVCVLISVLILIPGASWATALGVASNYNEFIFGDIMQTGTDSQGRVAAGGNVQYQNMSIASQLKEPFPFGDLVVGGDLFWRNGSVGYFDPADSGNPAYKKGIVWVGGIADVNETVTYGALNYGKPINFQAAQSYLTQSSAAWGTLHANGTVTVNPLQHGSVEIILTGYDPHLNIFNLSGADVIMANAGSFRVNIPPGSTVLVNIDGSVSAMQNFGFFFPDEPYLEFDWDPYILYNFYQATTLTFGAIEIHGSVLAPLANVQFSDGHIEGQLIAMSLTGTGEAHNEPFIGQIPETATLLLLGAGVIGLALGRRRIGISLR
jgi:choice-of-anchor A domain-containing protein